MLSVDRPRSTDNLQIPSRGSTSDVDSLMMYVLAEIRLISVCFSHPPRAMSVARELGYHHLNIFIALMQEYDVMADQRKRGHLAAGCVFFCHRKAVVGMLTWAERTKPIIRKLWEGAVERIDVNLHCLPVCTIVEQM